jgi:hypothetical protein
MAVISSGQITLTDLNDARQVMLYLNGNYRTQIYNPNLPSGTDTSYTPNLASSNLVITPELYIAGGDGTNLLPSAQVQSVTWYEGTQTTTAITENATGGTTTGGYAYTLPTGSPTTVAKPLTIKSNLKTANNAIFTCVVMYRDSRTGADIPVKAQFEITKITNGAKGDAGVNAITAVMTNENATVPTNSSGGSGVYTTTATEIHVYEGTTELQAIISTGTPTAGQFKVTQGTAVGITAGTGAVSGKFWNIGAANTITADTASVPYTITGKRADGTDFTATKTLSITRVKAGVDATTPTAYWLVPSTSVIQRNVNSSNALTPASISIDIRSQTGTGTPGFYGGRLVIAEQDSAGTWADKYGITTPANETAAKSYTPSANTIKAIRVRLYQAGVTPNGTTNMIDEETIVVVDNGVNAIDAHYLNVWAPKGDTVRNSAGTLDLQADLYKGAALATGTITYQWYIQDSSSTAAGANGGDADGGDGWRKLDATTNYGVTNYTTKTATVPATAIAGVEGFKCVAKLNGNKFAGVIVVRDFQDPVSVNVLGANIFKNGEGSVTLTAQLLQAGQEIATTGYTFSWALYATNGNLIKTLAGTGPTITVAGTDVDGTANLVVEVSK